VALLLGGCAIDVDLSSSPSVATVGQTVTFDIAVRNRSTCPVGGVVAVLVPFIPRDFFISQIPDPDLRQELSAFVDAFCSGENVTIPGDVGGSCRIENGELICEFQPAMTLSGTLPETAFAVTQAGDAVTCSSDGVHISCRFPHALVAQAMAQAATSEPSLGALQCVAGSNAAVCGALLLDPDETKTAQVQLTVPRPGMLRNWIVSLPTVDAGVCTAGLVRRRPCNDDGDCTGMGNTCGSGVCGGGTRDGFGCNADSDCGGGTCTTCDVSDDGQVLSGVACTTTAISATAAPALSPLALLAVVMLRGGPGARGGAPQRRR
jgi:hypothetical protein